MISPSLTLCVLFNTPSSAVNAHKPAHNAPMKFVIYFFTSFWSRTLILLPSYDSSSFGFLWSLWACLLLLFRELVSSMKPSGSPFDVLTRLLKEVFPNIFFLSLLTVVWPLLWSQNLLLCNPWWKTLALTLLLCQTLGLSPSYPSCIAVQADTEILISEE